MKAQLLADVLKDPSCIGLLWENGMHIPEPGSGETPEWRDTNYIFWEDDYEYMEVWISWGASHIKNPQYYITRKKSPGVWKMVHAYDLPDGTGYMKLIKVCKKLFGGHG